MKIDRSRQIRLIFPQQSATDPTSVNFTEELSDELAAQFEEAMKTFLSRDPHMMEQIEKLAEAAGSAGNSSVLLIVNMLIL